jgi:hypothetical protein
MYSSLQISPEGLLSLVMPSVSKVALLGPHCIEYALPCKWFRPQKAMVSMARQTASCREVDKVPQAGKTHRHTNSFQFPQWKRVALETCPSDCTEIGILQSDT